MFVNCSKLKFFKTLVFLGVDVQTVIAERDRAKTKGDLLTDKCKKFLAKAKQLEAKGKIDEAKLAEAASQIQTLTEELTLIRDEITAKVDVIQSLEFEIGKMREREVYLEEKTAELDTSKGPLLDLQTQVEDLKHKLEQSRASNEELVIEITEKQQAYTDLSAQLDNLASFSTFPIL
jgi:chromosome segregation ATPase